MTSHEFGHRLAEKIRERYEGMIEILRRRAEDLRNEQKRSECRLLFVHQHCPNGCDHPQSFVGGDYDEYGNAFCECCWFRLGVVTMLEPCTVENCGGRDEKE